MPNQNMPPTRYTIKPGRFSQITLKTLPDAVCTLRSGNETDPARCMKLYADDEGLIQFDVRPSDQHRQTVKFVVECEAKGQLTKYPLELRPHSEATEEMPLPEQLNPKKRRKGAKVRPALSWEASLRLTDKELAKKGYPLRPDQQAAPVAFNAWRKVVSTPSTLVEARSVARPDISHARKAMRRTKVRHGRLPGAVIESSNNWSGFELSATAGTFDWVSGMWHVPSVSGESNTITFSSYWVGLDGDGITDLVQAGTEQENLTLKFFGVQWSISYYYAWTQFLPQRRLNGRSRIFRSTRETKSSSKSGSATPGPYRP
jgi:Peptidase A4 family